MLQKKRNQRTIVLKFLMRAASKGWNGKAVWTVPKKFLLALLSLSNPIYTLDTMFCHQLMHNHWFISLYDICYLVLFKDLACGRISFTFMLSWPLWKDIYSGFERLNMEFNAIKGFALVTIIVLIIKILFSVFY